MKVVILAGGYGTRISEESHFKPKPMIEIGDFPILWHIMKMYYHYGFDEFILCLGYKGYMIKEFFSKYFIHKSDITYDFKDKNSLIIHNDKSEKWKVTLIDTGKETQTGGRIKKIQQYLNNDDTFMLTYGDGLSNVNLNDLLQYHEMHKKMLTITAVNPGFRFGKIDIDKNNDIIRFEEKLDADGGWINGGFMVCNKEIFDYIDNDYTIFESDTLGTLSTIFQMKAYKHSGFWQCMDTQRDKRLLEQLWEDDGVILSNSIKKAPWRCWDD